MAPHVPNMLIWYRGGLKEALPLFIEIAAEHKQVIIKMHKKQSRNTLAVFESVQKHLMEQLVPLYSSDRWNILYY